MISRRPGGRRKKIQNSQNLLAELVKGNNKKLLSEICEPVDYIPEMIKADQLLTRFDKDHKGVKVVTLMNFGNLGFFSPVVDVVVVTVGFCAGLPPQPTPAPNH